MTKTPIKHRAAEEDGWVLVTAIMLLAIMLVMAFASMSVVDGQQKRDRQQRERESSLNLAETALYQQGFKLAQTWPSPNTPAADCSSATSGTTCAPNAQVLANTSNVDTKAATSWTTKVRDNGGNLASAWQTAYANAAQSGTTATGTAYTCASPCNYDANGDRKMWVQAQSTVRGRTRTVVATLKLEQLAESIPQTAVVAGGINTGNNGSQTKIYAVGSSVIVRCSTNQSSCVSDPSAIQPTAAQGTTGNLMTPSQIQRFKQRAIADNTYYAGCPTGSSWNVTGAVVFVDNCVNNNAKLNFSNNSAATCSSVLPPKPVGGGNGLQPDCINSLSKPGLLIWHCGGFGTSGKGTFIGIMYFVNGSDDSSCTQRGASPVNCSGNNTSSNNVLSTTGGLGVLGAVAIDGPGCLYASANGIQVQYDPNVFSNVASYGTVGLVQDTWRELVPN